MKGNVLIRIDVDADQDGKIDRWEYYDANRKLEKVGVSRANDGREDAWSYFGPDGTVLRIEISGPHDGRIARVEYYDRERLTRAEADSDDAGAIGKWETLDKGRLQPVTAE